MPHNQEQKNQIISNVVVVIDLLLLMRSHRFESQEYQIF